MITIGLVGDYNASIAAHQAIPSALQRSAELLQLAVDFKWVGTPEITSTTSIADYDGLWCVPGSPYQNMEGALLAIRYARENHRPFLGTCGGFQHAVIEYARNVLGWVDADHAESAESTDRRIVISALQCSLVEVTAPVRLVPASRIAAAYGTDQASEGYRCRYGINPEFQTLLTQSPNSSLRATAHDATGEVRAIEIDGHPFFLATLFQPERAALRGQIAPVVSAYLAACAAD